MLCDIEVRHKLTDFIKEKLSKTNTQYLQYGSNGDSCSEEITQDYLSQAEFDLGAEWGEMGASKAVFAFKEFPQYVFKIPFKGSYCEYYDNDTDEYYLDDETQEFYNAGDYNKNNWDYCETEESVYEDAKTFGFSEMLAGTFFLCAFEDLLVYVSERVDGHCYSGYDYVGTQQSQEQASELNEKHHYVMSDKLIAALVDEYGYDMVDIMLDYFNQNYISDFHSHNILQDRKTGSLKIIDYSGFND